MDEQDPVTERARQRVGATLKEKWRLDGLIGVGGMAAVYSATHRNGNRVAVKMLHAELSVDPEIRTRFLREGRVANKVEHPGAVTVQDDETSEDGSVFLVMELLEGETLAHRFERKGRSLVIEEVLLIADQVLDVLAAAHQKQIVHRDIKPDNIFLTRTGGVKLLDFGIARLRELSTQSTATRSGSTMGTPAYMAPEQARARWDEVDGRTDLWAVGATMFKLLTGRVVHVADTINEQLLAAMTVPAPPIATLVPTVPIPVVEVVDKALAFVKTDRWSDAESMRQAVRAAYQAIAGVAPTSVRLSFDDGGPVPEGHADTIAASTKVLTSSFSVSGAMAGSIRPRKRRKVLGALVLGLLGLAGYFVVRAGGAGSASLSSLMGADAGAPMEKLSGDPAPQVVAVAPAPSSSEHALAVAPAESAEAVPAPSASALAQAEALSPHGPEPAASEVVPTPAPPPPPPAPPPRPTVPVSVDRSGNDKASSAHKASTSPSAPAKKKPPVTTTKKHRRP